MSDARYLVLAGGLSHERDVSLRSGRRVLDALRHAGLDVELRDADAGLLGALSAGAYAAVLVALHGGPGEDGALREVLELAGVPYVGSTPSACRLAWDKPTAKALAERAGLSTPHAAVLPHATFRELGAGAVIEQLVEHLGLPLMVKPARGGSALGATAVRTAEELPAAMVSCFSYGEAALVERFVAGTEVAVGVVDTGDGPRALPAVEIRPLSGVYDYSARYTAGQTEFFVPARLPDAAVAEVARVAVTAHEALGLRDLSRVDLVVDDGGEVHLLEVNVSPGMTETSLLPMAVEAAGLSFGSVLQALLEQAAARG
jgi:D-alanine-D-alanine ligase